MNEKVILSGAAKKLEAHIWERETNEHYVEPEWCSARLFEEESFHPQDRTGSVWDPCCGFGTIPKSAHKAGYATIATDIIDRGYSELSKVADFLTLDIRGHDIVCNPPFNIAGRFAEHALKLARRKVALVFPTARLNAAHWLQGTPLKTIWLMTPRPSMPPGHTILAGEKPGGGKMDFCWIVFEHGYQGFPDLRWLRRGALK